MNEDKIIFKLTHYIDKKLKHTIKKYSIEAYIDEIERYFNNSGENVVKILRNRLTKAFNCGII